MLNSKTNVGKLRNGVFAYFQDGRQKSRNLTYLRKILFFDNVFHPKLFVLCLKMVSSLKYVNNTVSRLTD